MYELRHYVSQQGEDLFVQWLEGLRDRHAQARIAVRLVRLENGNFGDCRSVGEGVWELKIDWGPGYRVYYAIEDKRTQPADIGRAIDRWKEWRQRNKK